MLDLIWDWLAPESQLRKLHGLASQGALEQKVQVLMEDTNLQAWEKVDPLINYGRTLHAEVIPLLLSLYAATTKLRVRINRAQRRKGGISICDEIDTVHHFFFFALETYRGYPERVLRFVSYLWDDLAARLVRGKPDHEDLLANRLGMKWGSLLKKDPSASAGHVIARNLNRQNA
jgi:hypothetical protein